MTTTKFVCYGINERTLFRDALSYLAETKEEAIATCQRLNPDFRINRIEACACPTNGPPEPIRHHHSHHPAMATSSISRIIHLDLTELEATWLRALVQNPLGNELEDEDEFNRSHREAIFSALDFVR